MTIKGNTHLSVMLRRRSREPKTEFCSLLRFFQSLGNSHEHLFDLSKRLTQSTAHVKKLGFWQDTWTLCQFAVSAHEQR